MPRLPSTVVERIEANMDTIARLDELMARLKRILSALTYRRAALVSENRVLSRRSRVA